MKRVKKVLLLVLCAVLLVGASVAGTLAYLTDTQDVTNTFTVGNVHIKLDEAVVNSATGEAGTGRTEDGNQNLHLIPGKPVVKDPTVTVLKGSEACYVRMKVTVDVSKGWTDENLEKAEVKTESESLEDAFRKWAPSFEDRFFRNESMLGFDEEHWKLISTTANADARTITYIANYNTVVGKDETKDTKLENLLFDKVEAPATMTNDEMALLGGMEIKVEAHAIQADTFEADEGEDENAVVQKAWAAYDYQMNPPEDSVTP